MQEIKGKWQFWIDRGGTFTDIVAHSPQGTYCTQKLLSENLEHYSDAALEGIRRILGGVSNAPIPLQQIDHVKMGTTIATNALLERKGERVALVITKGFADALRIGYQNRPRLFELNIQLPQMLYETVIEVNERMSADGKVLRELDEAALMLWQLYFCMVIDFMRMNWWRRVSPNKSALRRFPSVIRSVR